MNEKYRRAFDIGIAAMNKFSFGSEEYELGRKLLVWACEQNRREQKVELVPVMEQNIEEVLEKYGN